jgi:predicted transposase/invertase (TIGR01784 family)
VKTDTIFYQLFQTFPNLLFELIGENPAQAQSYDFSSREIKELARTFDGIFLPVQNQAELPIYFVEVQFQSKPNFYSRFFTEIFVYLGQYEPPQNWRAVAVFASRNLDPGLPQPYKMFAETPYLTQVYLDEIAAIPQSSLGLGIVQLVMGQQESAVAEARQLVQTARQEVDNVEFKEKVIELIETVLIYKLPKLNRKELEQMFGLEDLKKTQYFQDVAAEAEEQGELKGKLKGKLESVPGLLKLGLTIEQIAGALELDVELVKSAAEKQSGTDTTEN